MVQLSLKPIMDLFRFRFRVRVGVGVGESLGSVVEVRNSPSILSNQ